MAGPGSSRSELSERKQPKDMMSFGRAMKPTPSEITVASTAYSTATGPGYVYEDAPPVPPVPKVHIRPHVEDDDQQDENFPSPTPRTPQPESPSVQPSTPLPKDEDRQKGFDIALARLEGTYDVSEPDETRSPISNDQDRQKSYDIALARLEGTYIEPDDSSISQSESDVASQERKENRFENWMRHQAKKAERQEAGEQGQVPHIEVAPPTPLPGSDEYEEEGYGGRGGMLQDPDRLTVPLKKHKKRSRSRSANDKPRHQPKAGSSRVDKFKEFTTPVAPEQRVQAPHDYYPYVASPGCFDVPEHKLKNFLKKAKNVIVGPPKPRLYDQMVAQVEADPALKAALECRPWPPTNAPQVPATANEAIAAGFRAQPAPYTRAPAAAHTRPSTATTHRTRYNPELENPAPGSTWNGNRTADDIRKPLAPVLSLEEAQRRFLGHPELSPLFAAASTPVRTNIAAPQPTKPIKIVGHPDRGTCFGDFINAGDLPETAEEAFDPTPRPVSSRSLRRSSFVADPDTYHDPQLSAKYAIDYQAAIDTPQFSPIDLSELSTADYPTNTRVLYDPKLCSHVDMPKFDQGYRPSSAEMFDQAGLEPYGDRVSKALREDQLRGHRAANASKQSLAVHLDADEVDRRNERMRRARKLEYQDKQCEGQGQEMMPAF